MQVLGFESSCDETGVALYDTTRGLLSHALHSQIKLHADYGGVVPELASRDHIRRVLPLAQRVLAEAGASRDSIDAIAYTRGPGLAGALLVGAATAKAIALGWNKPAIGVHHLEGHLLSPLLAQDAPSFPFLALLVSGGHTQIMRVQALGHYEILGDTLDDAAGEAFDKSAKLMGLGYPGGPVLAQRAALGVAGRYSLPRPLLKNGNLDFSFAGLKTAVLNQFQKQASPWSEEAIHDLCAEVQAAIVDVLATKTLTALKQTRLRTLVVAGGVGANLALRTRLIEGSEKLGAKAYFPPLQWCTDNGAMIALAGALRLQAGFTADTHPGLDVRPRWPLTEIGL